MHPTTIRADVMSPLPVEGPFDSAALNHVNHCLRGPSRTGLSRFRNVAAVLEPDGVLFGGTVLGTADGVRQILEESFQTVEVDVIGSIAHFSATGPRQAG